MAADGQGKYVAFVACPLIRDTPELPCWMVRHQGTLYYMGIQEGRSYVATWYQPQLKHKALVEGVVAEGEQVCGGVPLKDIHVSDLPEVSPECDEILPTKGFVSPKGRPIGPDFGAAAGQAPLLIRDVSPGAPVLYTDADVSARRPLRFEISYNFNSDFLQFPAQQNRVVQAQAYAKAIKAREIRLTAFRGAALLSDGQVLNEDPVYPARRKDNLVTVLTGGFDIPADIIKTEVRADPEAAVGNGDHANRRVYIDVVP
jgi:hypothetical protein